MPISFKFGSQPVEILLDGLAKDLRPTANDFLLALNRQKTRILERTAQGVDVDGNAFAPYSSNGPFYWYPGKTAKKRRAAVARAMKQVGGERTRVGLKFKSYGDFKRSLGRPNVDLTGPSAPHMLQAIVVAATDDGGKLGIYGSEADRAEGHNNGSGHLPKREFFGISESDAAAITADLEASVLARMRRRLQ